MSLSAAEIAKLLDPYLVGRSSSRDACVAGEGGPHAIVETKPSPRAFEQFATYLSLILKWNARTNLTAIRDPEEIVRRHFGESLFLGRHLVSERCLLDFGSGAGFPGIPVQILRPDRRIVLAESQGKKAVFLREVVRVLELTAEVWAGRAEEIGSAYQFDAVMMRAVDRPSRALDAAALLAPDIYLLITRNCEEFLTSRAAQFRVACQSLIPDGSSRILLHLSRR